MESRMQELMSSYYDLSDKEEHVNQSKNIDATGFMVDEYVKGLLEKMSMDDLLKRDDQMIREIKELDTNMQMLVYENYNKFISATDTIRKMKTNVETMESEVKRVVESMDKITLQSENVGNALAPFRSKVEKLVGVRRLLKRLDFIFQLPQRLKSAIKAQEYEKATKYFVIANRILKRYQHIASFKTIQQEAEHIMVGLRTIVQKKYDDEATTPSHVEEYSLLLLDLNVNPIDVRQRFLDWHQKHMDKILAPFQSSSSESLTVMQYITNITQAFVPMFHDIALAFLRVFGALQDPNHRLAFNSSVVPWYDTYATLCESQCQRPLSTFSSEDDKGSNGYGILMLVLQTFINGVKTLNGPQLPMDEIRRRTRQAIEASIRYQVDAAFLGLKREFAVALLQSYEQLQTNTIVPPIANKLSKTFVERMEQMLQRMQPLIGMAAHLVPDMSRSLSDLVQSRFNAFFKWLIISMELYIEPARERVHRQENGKTDEDVIAPEITVTPPFLILLACFFRDISQSCISHCIQILVECLPVFDTMDPGASLRNESSKVDAAGIVNQSNEASLNLLHHYCMIHGNRLSTTLRKGMETQNWLDVKEPRLVRTSIDNLIDEMTEIAKYTSEIFGEPLPNNRTISGGIRDLRRQKTNPNMRLTGSGSLKTPTSSGHLFMDIARIFAKKIQVFYGPTFACSLDSVLTSTFKIAFKAWGEYVRMTTFGKYGVQQLQVDTDILKSIAAMFVSQEANLHELDSLLTDVVTNAMERALEVVLMEERFSLGCYCKQEKRVISLKRLAEFLVKILLKRFHLSIGMQVLRRFSSLSVPASILPLGTPALRQASKSVLLEDLSSPAFRAEMEQLRETLENFRKENGFGRGIAAPQIGIQKRFLAINLGDGAKIYINPTITKKSIDTFSMWDDCMCFPDLLVKVTRHRKIAIEYLNENGDSEALNNMDVGSSELFQHEIDHLDGVLAVDRAELNSQTSIACMNAEELIKNFPEAFVSSTAFKADKTKYEALVDYVI
ncbi:fat-free family protein [Thraustotheca clavata]|uniref:peptide deformylase n=1 Tax=Thraustotheca clavata TaxID=74557 RepID=A0A1V9ZQP4_9STRA|nr:fat-free family protein [Thraustotheca clavata]